MRVGIRVKTIVPVIVLLAIGMSGMSLYNYFSQVGIMNSEIEKNLKSAVTFTDSAYAEQSTVYLQMARFIARMPTVAEALAKGDRNRLLQEFLSGYEAIKTEFKITQVQFHTPPAMSFLRLAQPDKYGDDLSAFRSTVLAAYEKRKSIVGIEVGKAGVGLRVLNRYLLAGSMSALWNSPEICRTPSMRRKRYSESRRGYSLQRQPIPCLLQKSRET